MSVKVICNYQDYEAEKKAGLEDVFDGPILQLLEMFNSEFGLFKGFTRKGLNGIVILTEATDFFTIGQDIKGWPSPYTGTEFWKNIIFEVTINFGKISTMAFIVIDSGESITIMFDNKLWDEIDIDIIEAIINNLYSGKENFDYLKTIDGFPSCFDKESLEDYVQFIERYKQMKEKGEVPSAQEE